MADVLHVQPCRPYILRALYDWMVDNHLTPQISVNVNCPGVQLPLQYAQNGIIILNISTTAVRNLSIDNEAISFCARFGGVPHDVYVPMYAVTTIYPREDMSLGMCMFPEKAYDDMFDSGVFPQPSGASGKARLSEVENISAEKRKGFEVVDNTDDVQEADRFQDRSQERQENRPQPRKPTLEIVE